MGTVEAWEFECKCGCGLINVAKSTAARFARARAIAGVPFIVTSGCRCTQHNINVKGNPGSSHLASLYESHAGDIFIKNELTRYMALIGLLLAGFSRIGLGKNFIHADDDRLKNQRRTWVYTGDNKKW